MVKDHLESERGNLMPPLHGLLFQITSIITKTGPPPQKKRKKKKEEEEEKKKERKKKELKHTEKLL